MYISQKRFRRSSDANDRVVAWKVTCQFIDWMLNLHSLSFLSFSAFNYILLTFNFALIIMLAGWFEPSCITSSSFGRDGGSSFSARLNDAWQLSWTTFSTVGYGWVSPSTSAIYVDNTDQCVVISVILSFECLLGILSVSFAGAIIFVKLMQFQSIAKVKFSSIMLVTFGSELEENFDDSTFREYISEDDQNNSPCPVLVFRIANLLHDNVFGDVVSARVQSVATVQKENSIVEMQSNNTQFSNALQSSRNVLAAGNNLSRKLPNIGFGRGAMFMQSQKGHPNEMQQTHSVSNAKLGRSMFQQLPKGYNSEMQKSQSTKLKSGSIKPKGSIVHKLQKVLASKNSPDDKGVGTQRVLNSSFVVDQEKEIEMPNLVFEKVSLEPDCHPCFTTSWMITHTLDENSPLVKREIREKIKTASGRWPEELANEKTIKDSVDFDQFLVSFRGLSKSSGTEVYASKVYKKDDLRFGYQFKSILTQRRNGRLSVVSSEIDAIKPQS